MAIKVVQVINIINKVYSFSAASVDANENFNVKKSKYGGTSAAYLEVVGYTNNASYPWGSTLLWPSGATVNNTALSGTNTSPVRVRATTDCWGDLLEVLTCGIQFTGSTKATITINAARLVIIQSSGTSPATETQIEIGEYLSGVITLSASPTYCRKYWYFDSTKWSASPTFYVDVTYICSNTKGAFTAILQQSGDNDFTFADLTTIVNAGTSTTIGSAAVTVRTAFTPTSGRNYRLSIFTSATKYSVTLCNAKIIVQGSSSRYEAVQTIQSTFPPLSGLQNCEIAYYSDTTEWQGINQSVYYEVDSTVEGVTAKLQSDPNGTPVDVPNSDITLVAGRTRSSALTMPTGTPAIIDAYSGSSNFYVRHFKLIFQISPASTSSIKTVQGLAIASVKTVQGTAIASVKTIQGLASIIVKKIKDFITIFRIRQGLV